MTALSLNRNFMIYLLVSESSRIYKIFKSQRIVWPTMIPMLAGKIKYRTIQLYTVIDIIMYS